jgi:2-keto-4-pentenoate hydratase/2-oxohepta-3-ene-1,7-dioic acid hydratase in catechol pathway
MTWSLITAASGGTRVLGVRLEDGRLVAPPELKQWDSMLALLNDWPRAVEVLTPLDPDDAPVLEVDEVLSPLLYPPKVMCAGVNYRRHIREMGGEVPGQSWVPYFFLKPPSTAVIGPTAPIVVDDSSTTRPDWEAELAVVMGVGGREIPVSRALDHVAGYAVANDISARGMHKRTDVPAEAFAYDWFASKAADASLPLGPGITPAFLIADPQNLRIRLWVNDELQQDESTGDMICTVAELVSAASRFVTLEPGDVIATGTPAGVGAGRGLHLHNGDVVRVAIDGLGELVNNVSERKRSS